MNSNTKPISKTNWSFAEDWTVVGLGALLIGLIVLGLPILTPSFSWQQPEELIAAVFSLKNSGVILAQFGLTYAIALLGTLLMGKPW